MSILPSRTEARALVRAHKNHLEIVGHGFTIIGHHRVLGVRSASDPDRCIHLVTVYDLRLTCTCPAGRHGILCMHRALVHEYLLAERFASSDRRISCAEEQLHQVAGQLLEAEQRDHEERVEALDAARERLRETREKTQEKALAALQAIRVNVAGAKPISIFK